MKIQFLGCGDAFGAGGRLNTCFMVDAADTRFLIDCGATSLVAMSRFGVDPNSIDKILLTHLHGDHYGGVPFLLVQPLDRRSEPKGSPLVAADSTRMAGPGETVYYGLKRFGYESALIPVPEMMRNMDHIAHATGAILPDRKLDRAHAFRKTRRRLARLFHRDDIDALLADDSLEGRAPGTRGFEGAAGYAESALRALGLEPAGLDVTFRQPVPLRESIVVEGSSGMSVSSPSGIAKLGYGVDFYLSPDPFRETADLDDAPVAFVGYGVSASALGYDDYADIDVQGKVVAYLSGAPPVLPSNERAYYSSGATKQAEAIARGAVGILRFTYPDDPRFRWEVNVARAKRGSFAWVDDAWNPNRGDPAILGSASLNHSAAQALFAGAPRPLDDVFSSPWNHCWHHSQDLREAGHNYGEDVILWDHLFGAFYLPADREPSDEIGIGPMKDFPTRC
ncbi:MAG: MBL fold metallo-hydrolase [Proteobacteria bacterium]|nr:MBL fold metallo-hydrolase [Pseudomonadota bacterium]